MQCQACVLSLLSSVFAIVMGLVSDDTFRLDQALFVAACSMCTAAIASFLLGEPPHSGQCEQELRTTLWLEGEAHMSLPTVSIKSNQASRSYAMPRSGRREKQKRLAFVSIFPIKAL